MTCINGSNLQTLLPIEALEKKYSEFAKISQIDTQSTIDMWTRTLAGMVNGSIKSNATNKSELERKKTIYTKIQANQLRSEEILNLFSLAIHQYTHLLPASLELFLQNNGADLTKAKLKQAQILTSLEEKKREISSYYNKLLLHVPKLESLLNEMVERNEAEKSCASSTESASDDMDNYEWEMIEASRQLMDQLSPTPTNSSNSENELP